MINKISIRISTGGRLGETDAEELCRSAAAPSSPAEGAGLPAPVSVKCPA
jgi:hypothetical protein